MPSTVHWFKRNAGRRFADQAGAVAHARQVRARLEATLDYQHACWIGPKER